jgi:hypothetical protein
MKAKGAIRINSTQSDGSDDNQVGRLDHVSGGQRQNQGGTTGVESTQILWFSGSQTWRLACMSRWQKDKQGKPKTQGGPPGSSPLRSDSCHGTQTGRLDRATTVQSQIRATASLSTEEPFITLYYRQLQLVSGPS